MAATKIEQLEAAVNTLDVCLKSTEFLVSTRCVSYDKERSICAEIRGIVVASDFSVLHKVDRRYGDILAKAVENLFKMVNHIDPDIRMYAEESLDAIFRSLLLSFNHSRVIVLLITEIGRNSAARSVICALRRLAHVIHYGKCMKIVSYGSHILSALTSMLKRPEESIQNAIISCCTLLFDTLGPKMRSQLSEKAHDLYRVAVNNLELSGPPNRAAVIIIAHISTYYPSIMNKVFLRCMVNVRDADDALSRAPIIGSLNTLKAIWPLLLDPGCGVLKKNIQIVICSVLRCLYSSYSEVVVPCIELLEKITTNPLPWLRDFVPLEFEKSLFCSPRCEPTDRSSRTVSPFSDSLYDASSSFNKNLVCDIPLQLPNRSQGSYSSERSSSILDEEVIDPLMHADLYEEVIKCDRYEDDQLCSQINNCLDDSVGILRSLPHDVCASSANFFVYTAAILGKRFLLAGLKGLKNDRDVRISHKILALNCIAMISKYEDISKATIFFGNFEQSMLEVSRFILHDDDQLCASTVMFLFTVDTYRFGSSDNVHNYQRVMRSCQPIRKRSILQASIGQQHVLDALGLLSDALQLATTEVSSTFFLLKVTCGEFLSSLRWSLIKKSIKEKWQRVCFNAYCDLLFSDDQKVAHAASIGLEQLVRNADFTEYSAVFAARIPENLLSLDNYTLPAVLNMPPGFRFRGECPDFVVESNLEVIIDLIMDYFTFDVHKRSAGLCYTVNALLKAFPASVFCECWGCLSKQPSSSYGFLSTFLELCELNLNSIHKLSTGLRVIAALFAGHCESYMMNAVQEQSTFDRLSLPRLPEQMFLDRLLVLPLRVLNLYYCLITEYRSVNSQSSTSFISRPTFSPLSNRKLSSSRNADISKLLGTRIHPVLPTSYLESCTIKHLFHSVEGAHKNFLEHLDIDCESRFLLLLQAALDCLGTVCEMLTFSRLKPHLQEILLYVKAIFEVCPDGCTTLLHQLFKVVFGKNAANINLDILQSMKMKDPLPPLNEAEMLYLRYENDFTLFCAFVNRKEYIDAFVSRSLGWLKTDILSRVHNPPPNEIAPALQLFEGFVTLLLQVYNAFQSVPCKRAILGVMCELPRDGIIYAMADPKKVLFEAVTTQLYDPSAGNKELLKEIALYLIVLARTSVIKYDYLAQLAVQLIEKAIQSNAIQVISAVEVILLEILFVQRVDGTVIYSAFREKSENLFNMASQSTFLIWILFLHSSRNDENRWSSTSIDFFAAYSVYIANCSESSLSHSVFTAVIAFSCMAPAMYRPVDTIFCLLQNCMDEDTSFTLKLKRCVPLLFSILNNVAEEKLLMRIEQIIDNPLEWLVQSICGLLVECSNLTNISNQKVYDYVLFLFLTIVNMIKSDHYPKLSAALQVYLKSVNSLPLQQLITTYPVILSQWLQLLSLFKEPVTKHIDVSQCTEYVSRLCVALSSLSDESTSIPNIICKLPPQSELPTNCTLLEFCKSVFTGSLWCTNPKVFHILLSLESSDIYYVYECVEEGFRSCFFACLVSTISNYLTSQMAFPNAFKSAISKSQQLFDVIYDLVEFDGEAHENALRLKLFVLSRIHTMNINELVWGNFGPKEVLALIEYSAQELKHPYCDLRATCNGLKFLLEHCSTKEIFIGDIFFGIQSIRKVVISILTLLQEKARCKFDHFLSNDKIGIFFPDDDVPTSDFEDFGGLDGFISTLFYEVQNVCEIFRSRSTKHRDHLEIFCRVLFRHPVLHKLAIVPYTALKMNWRLRITIQQNSIHVPLVNIHLLCNLDILNDFAWRLNWLGWISRQQFEDFWMSLFGVLSSTPTGNELISENNLTEQILASSVAVSVLTDILLYSLLYPEPGNPPTGHFIIKHRERNEPFYKSKSIQLLSSLKSKLTHDLDPMLAYKRNIERLDYKGDYYGLGQMSALSLWTLTGVLNDENPQQLAKADSPHIRLSLSEFLLKTTCELDTASSVRALFENFSHWFQRGLDHLPLPLLSSTVRSMALLSDLFDDSASYEFMFSQMRNVFFGDYLKYHSDIGYVIYSLLKSVTVIGLDIAARGMTEGDLSKQILLWVECGLTSRSPFVREATLHGFIYLMQSMTLDALKPVVQYVTAFLLEETCKHLSTNDRTNICSVPSSLEYIHLIWSASFRIMEEPLQLSFKTTLIQRTCEIFTVLNFSGCLLPVVTSGIEALVLHSACYLPQFLQLVEGCFEAYATISSTFVYALRILIACVFKEEVDPRRTSSRKFEVILEELYSIYRRCDSRDAELISVVLPSVLLRLYNEEKVFALISNFCSPLSSGGYPRHINYSLQMMYELCERMRYNQRMSSLNSFAQNVVFQIRGRPPLCREDRAVASCLLAAVSSYEYIAYRFPVYLAALFSTESFESSYEFLLLKAIEECPSSC